MSIINNSDLLVNELRQGQSQQRIQQVHANKKDKTQIGGGFAHFNLSQDILKAIRSKGYNLPTPI